MTPLFGVTDHWYDFRDLGNLSSLILENLDKILPYGIVYVVAILIGFVASFLLFVLPTQLFLGVLGERKIIGRIQSRYGPNRVGKFGVLQPIADAIKLIQKESLTPRAADRLLMYVAPIIFVAPAVMLFAVVPFGPNMVVAEIPVSIVYFLAVSSVPVLGNFMAGYSGNNKYSLFGAMRIVAMTISYEVPLVIAILGVIVMSDSMSLQGMVFWQSEFDIWLGFLAPIALITFFICSSAELNRTPTDIAEAESEIVAGYLTEYSGMKWGLFYGMDIGYALAASAFASTVFLGGWSFWGLEDWVPSWLIAGLKIQLFYLIFIWTRGTLPRLRIDQLMSFSWKFLLPVSLANLVILAFERMLWTDALDRDQGWLWLFAAVNIALAGTIVVAWARVLGHRQGAVPLRPRMVREAGGFTPVGGSGEAGR
jgi:NADH-quinone oxidoreductase subunit H